MKAQISRVVGGSLLLGLVALVPACQGVEEPEADREDNQASAAAAQAQVTWTDCTWQGGTCQFSGTHDVLYGVSPTQQNVVRSMQGPVACTDAVFGDPAYGIPKHCWVNLASAPPPVKWTDCTWEGGICNFSGSHTVLFGVSTTQQFVTKQVTGPVACTNAVFGDPAYGVAKHCWVDLGSGQPPPPPPPPPSSTQMYQLQNPNITAEAGQDVTLQVRFYAAGTLPDPSKVFTHFYAPSDESGSLGAMHHYEWIPTGPYPGYGVPYSQTWSGYVEYDYVVNVPVNTPPGTYRIASGIHEGVPPYAGRMDQVTCNGVPRLGLNQAVQVQMCHVGTLTVTPAVHPRSTATDGPMNMFALTGHPWAP